MDEVFDTNVDELIAQGQWYGDEPGATRPLRDYADHYEFDLAGNRVSKTVDYDLSTQAVDQVFTYDYDANDRLRWEHSDLDGDGAIDQLAESTYGENNSGTQQTGKRVETALGTPLSAVSYSYDLQGRLATTVMERFASDGTTLTSRESTSFDYYHTGFRVSANNKLERLNATSGELETKHELDTTYLADHQNFTTSKCCTRPSPTPPQATSFGKSSTR